MAIAREQEVLRTAGDLYVSFNYDGSKVFDDISATSIGDIRSYLLERSFTSVGIIKDFSVAHELTEERIVEVDNCGVGTWIKTAVPQYTANWTWLTTNNLPVIAEMFGLETYSQTNAAVTGFNQVVASGERATGTLIALSEQNGDLTAIVPTSVTGSVDGALTVVTDYTLGTDEIGRTTITPVAGGAITTVAQDLTVVYDYTPHSRQTFAIKSTSIDVPFVTLLFVGCNQKGNYDTATSLFNYTKNYEILSKVNLTGSLTRSYVNTDVNDLTGSDTSFVSNKGGIYFTDKMTYQGS